MSIGRALMVQGCTSGAGKSFLTAAICAALCADGVRVAPFKAQNMSNNAGVTADGLEMGRAQIVQARAAGIEPDVRMNPVLLKPEADDRSQVIVLGHVDPALSAVPWRQRSAALWPTARTALDSLLDDYDVVICEGAGSPAEVNLADSDYVNMAVARHCDAPVLLVADIDRGGAFAHLLGTWHCLEPADRTRLAGFVLNRFRGDASLLAPGPQWLEDRTGVPTLGVVPMLDIEVPEEDGLAAPPRPTVGETGFIAIVGLPRISNVDEFAALGALLRWARTPADLTGAAAIVLPGSKSVIADLEWLRESGLGGAVTRASDAGIPILGICGGMQMLGRRLHDPDGVESHAGPEGAIGLGLLDLETTWATDKITAQVETHELHTGLPLQGYEIHHGRTLAGAGAGEIIAGSGWRTGNVTGVYLHGLFGNAGWLADFCARAGLQHPATQAALDDRLAALGHAVREHLDWPRVRELVGL
jgi:adenosylcobyric acid synthase